MVCLDSQCGKCIFLKVGREGCFVFVVSSIFMFVIVSINVVMVVFIGVQFNFNEIKISQQGKIMLIDQSIQCVIINWKGFDVFVDEVVCFNQFGVILLILNWVIVGQESVIVGCIFVFGQVIIYNFNGVVFSGLVKVDVGFLIIIMVNISDEYFCQGKLIFDQFGNFDVWIVNDGSISVVEKGLVVFVVLFVVNNGVINVCFGIVVMVVGNVVIIDFYGDGLVLIVVIDLVICKLQDVQVLVSNGGVIQVDGGSVLIIVEQVFWVVDNVVNLFGVIFVCGIEVCEGSVVLVSKFGDIQIVGKIDVSGLKNGGDVLVSGQQVVLVSIVSIDVCGVVQGGSVCIGGDFQGCGELL